MTESAKGNACKAEANKERTVNNPNDRKFVFIRSDLLFNYFRFFHGHIFQRYILVAAPIPRFHFLDLVHHVLAFHYLAKHAIAEALGSGRAVIQEIVIGDINEEL